MMRPSGNLAVLVALFLAAALPARAGAEPERERDRALRGAAAGAELFPALPAGLNCAASYTRHNATYSWYDTSSAYPWDVYEDDDLQSFQLPFPFIYYGERFEWVAVSSNGWISFHEPADTGCMACFFDVFPSTFEPAGVIAPFWKDLDPSKGGTVPDQRILRLQSFGTPPNRAWVATWERFPEAFSPSSAFTFQVVLYERTNVIRFQYQKMTGDTASSSIGIENGPGTQGDQYSYDQRRTLDGIAIEYAPPAYPALNTCSTAAILDCGASLTAQPMGSTDQNSLYGCSLGPYPANDVLYKLTLPSVTRIDLKVTPNDISHKLRAFLFNDCDVCNCLEGGVTRVRTVLAPGDYYIAIDGLAATDTGPFDLSLSCDTLLNVPTGTTISSGSGSCSITAQVDRFADGRGVLTSDGMISYNADRTYDAIRVDGNKLYTTNPERSECAPFERMYTFADDATDKTVSYWRFNEGEVVQTVYASQYTDTGPTCCGLRVETEVTNTHFVPHSYEFRALYTTDFGPGKATGNCPTQARVEGGPLHVEPEPFDYVDEQNLSCTPTSFPPGRCATECLTPAEAKSADDLTTRLIVQLRGPSTADAVQGEWVQFFDVSRICGPFPPLDPWMGGYLPVPDNIDGCGAANALLYSWRVPQGIGTSCAVPANCLQPGESRTFTHYLGRGCRLSPCSSCTATSDVLAYDTKLCLGASTTLDGTASSIDGCTAPSTTTYQWYRDGLLMPLETNSFYTVNEAAEGQHLYELEVACMPPPTGVACSDRRGPMVLTADCAACSASATVTSTGTTACVGATVTLDGRASVLANCPGTPTYLWRKDGIEIPGASGLVVDVSETAAGTHFYSLDVSCQGPPWGLSCFATSPAIAITYTSGSAGTPADAGNSLLGFELFGDVVLRWSGADPKALTFDVLRGTSKLDLPLPGPALAATGLTQANWVDAGGVGGASLYVYRVRGVGCAGSVGPY